MKILIYKLIDPITKEIRYIGKTKNSLTKRLYEHCTLRNLKTNTYKNNWVKQILKLNLRPEIYMVEEVNDDNWIEREIYWIKFYKETGNKLTNTSDGGEGSFGYKMTKESIDKSLKTRKENGSLKRSEECKNLISLSKIGEKHSKEQTEKMAEKLRNIIYQYDLDNNLIKEWKGVRKCANTLSISHSSILRHLNTNKPYKGFIWLS